jgi:hypothetical protein
MKVTHCIVDVHQFDQHVLAQFMVMGANGSIAENLGLLISALAMAMRCFCPLFLIGVFIA